MPNVTDIYILAIIGSILLIAWLLSRFASYNYIMKNIAVIIEKMATKKIYKDFKKNKKRYYNQNGELSAAAIRKIQKYIDQLNISCQFYSQDFYFYYQTHKPILKCRVQQFIQKYINDHAEIRLKHNYSIMTPEQFFRLRKSIHGDMVGVYIIYNKNRKKHYVGQATRLFFRVNQHFTGHGNGDVYADYKRGKDRFTIKLVPLVNSGYYDLDLLEKDLIDKYNAYTKGYNKTRGNG